MSSLRYQNMRSSKISCDTGIDIYVEMSPVRRRAKFISRAVSLCI